ncbi:MAG: PadR family transcriptional regulator, partial [Anaerolineae bacterium]|nr:PadR family transcriptional regulator [Anaerolineae bacterium]
MSLNHAILGLLRIQPMTGYDLKHLAFDQTVAHFWRADQAQIYRTLDKMAGEGWVTSELEIQEDRPNRKVYQVTPAGEAELERWLREEQALYTHREAFLVQLFFASSLPDEVILQHIESQITGHQARLEAYQQIDMPPSDDVLR